MKRRTFLCRFAGIASYPAAIPHILAATRRPIVMGVFPRRNATTTYKLFTPMASYLSALLGIEVRLVIEKNFQTFWEGVRQKKYDLVHFNQYHYIVAHQHYGYHAVAMNEELGKSSVSGAIVVRKDTRLNNISDLAGKTIVFGGGPRAMQSYIVAKWLLRNGGLADEQYNSKFARTPPNAIISTYHRQADAAGTGDVILQLRSVTNRINISQMKILARSQTMAHLPWATSDRLSNEMTKIIQLILTSLGNTPSGQRILSRAELTGLVLTEDINYNQARTIIKDVYGDDYGVRQLQ